MFPNNVSIPSTIPGDSVNEQKTISGLSASLDITTKKMALQAKEYERCIDGATGDDDRMSVASDATTVFGGSLQEREVAARASRQRLSSMCKKFVELYDDAKASDDVDAQITLDDDRREVIRAASQFIESMRLSYPEMTGKDLATKMRIEFYLQKLSALFEVRPLFTPTLRDHPAYALNFPNVKALWATSEQAEKRKERDETQLDLEPEAKRCPTVKSTEVKEQNAAYYALATPKLLPLTSVYSTPRAETPAKYSQLPEVNVIPPGAIPKKQDTSNGNTANEQERRIDAKRREYAALEGKMASAQEQRLDAMSRRDQMQAAVDEKKRALEEKKSREEEQRRRRDEERRRQQEEQQREEAERRRQKEEAGLDTSLAGLRKAAGKEEKEAIELKEEWRRLAEEMQQLEFALAADPASGGADDDVIELGEDASGKDMEAFKTVVRKKKTPPKKKPATPPASLPVGANFIDPRAAPPKSYGRRTSPPKTAEGRSTEMPAPRIHPEPSVDAGHRLLVRLQAQTLAHSVVAKARPEKPFKSGTSNDYKVLMAKFDSIAKEHAMDSRARLIELSNWVTGPPQRIVNAQTASDDPDKAYAKARSTLDALFGRSEDAAATLIQFVKEGKKIGEHDHDAHVDLFSHLDTARATAEAGHCSADLDRMDLIRTILDHKLPHLSVKYWKAEAKAKAKGMEKPRFESLLDQMMQWITIIANMGKATPTPALKIAATSATAAPTSPPEALRRESYASKLVNSPPQIQSTTRCHVCEGYHATVECAILAKLDVESKVKKLSSKGLCFHCLTPGHRASACPSKSSVRCMICHKPHNTILHGRTMPTPAPRLSANATTFRPATAAAPIPASTAVESAMQQRKDGTPNI